jgi:hypothetical protein
MLIVNEICFEILPEKCNVPVMTHEQCEDLEAYRDKMPERAEAATIYIGGTSYPTSIVTEIRKGEECSPNELEARVKKLETEIRFLRAKIEDQEQSR